MELEFIPLRQQSLKKWGCMENMARVLIKESCGDETDDNIVRIKFTLRNGVVKIFEEDIYHQHIDYDRELSGYVRRDFDDIKITTSRYDIPKWKEESIITQRKASIKALLLDWYKAADHTLYKKGMMIL